MPLALFVDKVITLRRFSSSYTIPVISFPALIKNISFSLIQREGEENTTQLAASFLVSVFVSLFAFVVFVAPLPILFLLPPVQPVIFPVIAVLFGLNKCDIADLRCRPSCDNPGGSGRKLRQL